MTRSEFQALLNSGAILLDGATGSNLRASGMPVGVCTEQWVLEHPEVLQNLQRDYVDAGSRIVYAPSFGANRLSLSMYGLEDKLAEMNRALVQLSRDAVGGRAYVAGDMATCGKPVDVEGGVSYDTLIEVYREQAQLLVDAGVDLIGLETMMGVTECSAAIEAVRSVCDLPVMCTLTLDAVGAAYFDGDAELAAQTLPALGADAIGVNCGQGPELYVSVIQRMRAHTDLPLIAKPNAGLPVIQSDGSAVYGMSPGKFAREMVQLKKAGASILGGCCGTTPEHIRMLKEICC
ncbi:MAG: homocysteine S-methyltransferase family protein [Eubacteriales bacterium]|nr:homocysteine S-methyltransferase family protein [Eubacteriales bacterium]